MLVKKIFLAGLLIGIVVLEIVIKGGNLSPLLFQVLFNKNIDLRKSEPQRVNVLLLGIGGGKHDGPNLSDTIIFASLDLANPKITLVSLPRDIWLDELQGRINTAYASGESKKKGGGITLAKKMVSKITGQSVDYGIVIDFSGFVKAVDQMGGIEIDVDKTFDDHEYPIEGKENDPCGNKEEDLEKLATASSQLATFPCRYEHIHFNKGKNLMNGETALKYVRSRHAKGSEGTDFARSQRQEKVIRALRDKAFSLNVITNPTKIVGLYQTLQSSINTDIQPNEFDDFIKLAQKFQRAKIQSVVVDYGDQEEKKGGLLTHPAISDTYNFEWVLIPRAGKNDYSEIREYILCRLTRDDCEISEIP